MPSDPFGLLFINHSARDASHMLRRARRYTMAFGLGTEGGPCAWFAFRRTERKAAKAARWAKMSPVQKLTHLMIKPPPNPSYENLAKIGKHYPRWDYAIVLLVFLSSESSFRHSPNLSIVDLALNSNTLVS